MPDPTPLRLTLLGVGAHDSGIAASGLLIEANGQRVVLGAKGAVTGELDAHLTTDPSEGGSVGVYAGQGLTVEPRMVQVGSQSGWGYRVSAAGRTIAWAPRFSAWPEWADGSDVMFAEGAGWSEPHTSASGTVHAGALEVSKAAAEHGVKRLVITHQGRATLAARAAGHSLPFGMLGQAGQSFTLRRDTLAASPLRVRDLVMTKDGGRRHLPAPWAIRKALAEVPRGVAAGNEVFEVEELPEPEQDVAYGLWKAEIRPEMRYTLGPLYIPNHMDKHGEWTDAETLERGMVDYVRKCSRDIHLQHSSRVAGEWVFLMPWPTEVTAEMILPGMQKATAKPVRFPPGTVFIGVIWQDWAFAMVKAGALKGMSMGGLSRRMTARFTEAELSAAG